MGKRNLYLNTTPVEEAKERYLKWIGEDLAKNREQELIPVTESLGRITAEAVYADCSSPLFNAAAMDGIAVISKHTAGASESTPVTLKEKEDYLIVDTGDPVYPPYDAVIMAEDLLEKGENEVQILAAAPAWQHIRPIGEDIVAGEMLLCSYHKIRPIDIGVLLSGGIVKVKVLKRPKVGILPTGTEIVEPDQKAGEGNILESNSRMFEAMVTEGGGLPMRHSIVEDDYEKIKKAILELLKQNDMVLVNAGSSAGTEDYTVHILREIGEVLIHGVAIKPGKPVILARVNKKPVIGLPGYPVSAYIDFVNFVEPVMGLYTGERHRENQRVQAVLSKRLVSSLKHREYVRVKVGRVGEKLVAAPLARGAGAAMSLVRADGFCVIEQNSEGFEAGETVDVDLYRSREEIDHTLVCIGSHDLILDLLADMLPNRFHGSFLSSTHVGSMGGLMALKRGEAHFAPIHLLDEETGVYNTAYLKRLFAGKEMALIKGVKRIQGIMVQKGNPQNIQGIEDLKRVRYINRQRGAGTRVLLDYKLSRLGIKPDEIDGYETEAATHMAVAALVKSGSVDAGMGILSAARSLGLDFIPVGEEEYDFALSPSTLELKEMKEFLEILTGDEFKTSVEKIGGYDCTESGKVIFVH